MTWIIDMFINIGKFLKDNIPGTGMKVAIDWQPYCVVVTTTMSFEVEMNFYGKWVTIYSGSFKRISRSCPPPYSGQVLQPLNFTVPGLQQSFTLAMLIVSGFKQK